VTLKEYLFGRRIVLRSPHRKEWVIDQIKRSVAAPWNLMNHGVSGGVFLGRLRLAWNIPMVSNGFRPVFRGQFVERGRETELHTVFGATTYLRVFLTIWYLFLTVFIIMGLGIGLANGGDSNALGILAAVPIFILFPIGIHLIFNANADKHYDAILDLLAREADLRPVTAR
jgi:hypothetical protein